MRRIYSENYRADDSDFKIEALKDNGKIMVKIYKIVDQKSEIVPQFQVSLTVAEEDDSKIPELKMFKKIIEAARLFLQNFQ